MFKYKCYFLDLILVDLSYSIDSKNQNYFVYSNYDQSFLALLVLVIEVFDVQNVDVVIVHHAQTFENYVNVNVLKHYYYLLMNVDYVMNVDVVVVIVNLNQQEVAY